MFHHAFYSRLLTEKPGGIRERVFKKPGEYRLSVPHGINVIWVDGTGAGGGGGGGASGGGAGAGGGSAFNCHALPIWLPPHTGPLDLFITMPSGGLGGNGGVDGAAGEDGVDGEAFILRANAVDGTILLKLEGGPGGRGAPLGGAGGASRPTAVYATGTAGGSAANGGGGSASMYAYHAAAFAVAGAIMPGVTGGGGGGWNGTGTGGTGGASAFYHSATFNSGANAGSTLGASGGAGAWNYGHRQGVSANNAKGGPPIGTATATLSDWDLQPTNTATKSYFNANASDRSDAGTPGGGGGGGGTGVAGGHGGQAWCRITW